MFLHLRLTGHDRRTILGRGRLPRGFAGLLLSASCLGLARAQEGPYFVAYDHHMEEPGNLEVSFKPVAGKPKGADAFVGAWTELEYGTKTWWTTEFYLEGSEHPS